MDRTGGGALDADEEVEAAVVLGRSFEEAGGVVPLDLVTVGRVKHVPANLNNGRGAGLEDAEEEEEGGDEGEPRDGSGRRERSVAKRPDGGEEEAAQSELEAGLGLDRLGAVVGLGSHALSESEEGVGVGRGLGDLVGRELQAEIPSRPLDDRVRTVLRGADLSERGFLIEEPLEEEREGVAEPDERSFDDLRVDVPERVLVAPHPSPRAA